MPWTLTIEFDSLEKQFERDCELGFPNDEQTQCVSFLTNHWALLPEEIGDDITIEKDKLIIHADVLDYIVDFYQFLLSRCIPKSVYLVRNDDHGE